jgi:hypothetical protein
MLTIGIYLGIYITLLVACEIGRRTGRKLAAERGVQAFEGLGAVDGAAFAMLTLLIAFSFSAAATRFEARRHLIVEETNAIGTAYLRLDLLPAAAQPKLRQEFGTYVDARLAVYDRINQTAEPESTAARVAWLQSQIWSDAVAACAAPTPSQVTMLVLPALNAMIDITTTRAVAHKAHTPTIILVLLYVLALISSVLAGNALAQNKGRSLIHMFAFVTIVSIALFVVLDYELPRAGLIRIDPVDQILKDLRKTMP